MSQVAEKSLEEKDDSILNLSSYRRTADDSQEEAAQIARCKKLALEIINSQLIHARAAEAKEAEAAKMQADALDGMIEGDMMKCLAEQYFADQGDTL